MVSNVPEKMTTRNPAVSPSCRLIVSSATELPHGMVEVAAEAS